MELLASMQISANGLQVQRTAVKVISTNLANVHTTRTENGGPYRRKQAVFSSSPIAGEFPEIFSVFERQQLTGVKVDVVEDPRPGDMRYDPSHPDADENGLVEMPNVNVVEEMVWLLEALRSYEANVTAFQSAKQMVLKSLEISK